MYISFRVWNNLRLVSHLKSNFFKFLLSPVSKMKKLEGENSVVMSFMVNSFLSNFFAFLHYCRRAVSFQTNLSNLPISIISTSKVFRLFLFRVRLLILPFSNCLSQPRSLKCNFMTRQLLNLYVLVHCYRNWFSNKSRPSYRQYFTVKNYVFVILSEWKPLAIFLSQS